MTADPRLAAALGTAGPVLFDFDGPVCSLFANYPARDIAISLRELLAARGYSVPDDVPTDPMAILTWTAGLNRPALLIEVEEALCAAELRAAETAEPEPYGHEAIRAVAAAGRPIGVVSNNSGGAVTAYLTAHGLVDLVATVVGRAFAEPALMKPSPEPILRAAAELGMQPGECVLIGDSTADVQAARTAGCRSISYANKPGKRERLAGHGTNVVIQDMSEIKAISNLILERMAER